METEKYIVMAHRSTLSVMGTASAPCKGKDGKILTFDTKKKAETYRNKITKGLVTLNVSYILEPIYICPDCGNFHNNNILLNSENRKNNGGSAECGKCGNFWNI